MKSTKRIRPNKKAKVPIAVESQVALEDSLPLPFVHYPSLYGVFIGFSASKDSELFFCSCSKASIENHFKLNGPEGQKNWDNELIKAPLSSHFFPDSIAKLSLSLGKEKVLNYKDKVCHRCNLTTPSLRYCHEMYGGNFKQHYGWYISQSSFRLGVRGFEYLNDVAAPELIKVIDKAKILLQTRNELSLKHEGFNQKLFEQTRQMDKEISKLKRQVGKVIENETRMEFGFRKIGEGHISETILLKIVKKLLEGKDVIFHYRPNWLQGMELDIYIPSLNTGVEYQGQQHFHPVKAWGGKKALEKVQERDSKKRQLCQEKGVKLIEVDYTEPLSMEYIRNKICA